MAGCGWSPAVGSTSHSKTWLAFPHCGNVPGQAGRIAYGVCYNTGDSGFDYTAGVELEDFAPLPGEFFRLRIAKQRYAVFTPTEHVSAVRGTFMAIFDEWLPKLGYQTADAPPSNVMMNGSIREPGWVGSRFG
jgi:AraC family transcriptional regulator